MAAALKKKTKIKGGNNKAKTFFPLRSKSQHKWKTPIIQLSEVLTITSIPPKVLFLIKKKI